MTIKNLAQIFFFGAIMLCSQSTKAQYYFFDDDYYDRDLLYEVGLSFNAMNCLTDLGGHKGKGAPFLKDLNTGKTKFSVGIFGAVTYHNEFGLRVEATYGNLYARDNVLKGITDIAKERYNRNLDFQTTIVEGVVLGEIHPLFVFIDWAAKDRPPPRISPYLLGGVGYFSFRPQGSVPGTNSVIDLKPLHTEGQGFPEFPNREDYKLTQINFPVGIGAKYELGPLFAARLEVLHRILKTDYLDDLSERYIDPALFAKYLTPQQARIAKLMNDKQINPVANPSTGRRRGNPDNNDSYFTINLKISLIIGRDKQ